MQAGIQGVKEGSAAQCRQTSGQSARTVDSKGRKQACRVEESKPGRKSQRALEVKIGRLAETKGSGGHGKQVTGRAVGGKAGRQACRALGARLTDRRTGGQTGHWRANQASREEGMQVGKKAIQWRSN
jgi:hypothetical protein